MPLSKVHLHPSWKPPSNTNSPQSLFFPLDWAAQSSQPIFIEVMLQPCGQLSVSLQDLFQKVHIFLLLDRALQVGSHRSRGGQSSPLTCRELLMLPRLKLAFWAASTRYWIVFSFSSTSTPKSFSSQSILHLACTYAWVSPARMQDSAIALVEFHRVFTGSSLKLDC